MLDLSPKGRGSVTNGVLGRKEKWRFCLTVFVSSDVIGRGRFNGMHLHVLMVNNICPDFRVCSAAPDYAEYLVGSTHGQRRVHYSVG